MEISAGEFKARCLKLMDEVANTRETLVITKRGKPVAKLVPFDNAAPFLLGYLKESVSYSENDAPVAETWNADAD
jgi:prevent-host-death family protein